MEFKGSPRATIGVEIEYGIVDRETGALVPRADELLAAVGRGHPDSASVAIFGSFFFLNSRRSIWRWAMSWMPRQVRRQIDDSGQVAWNCLSGYTRGIILVAVADGILVFVGLLIFQVPLAAVVALGTLSFGITGALVAVPAAATVYSVAKYLTGRMPPPREVPPTPRKPRLPGFLRRHRAA